MLLETGGPVASVDFSPTGQAILTGSFNGAVRLWNLDGKPLAPPLRQGHMVDAARFSPDGERILVVVRGRTARVWDLATGEGAMRVDPVAYFPLAVSPDRQTILARDETNMIQLRDAGTNQPLGVPLPHLRSVRSSGNSVPSGRPQACNSDRRRALTVDDDNVARLWDTQTGAMLAMLKPAAKSTIFAAAFSPDGKLLATRDFEWTAHLWNAETGEHIRKFEHDADGPVFTEPSRRGCPKVG